MDAIYAMGACVTPPMDSLANFDFLGKKRAKPKFKGDLMSPIKMYIETIFVFVVCALVLVGCFVFFQVQLKVAEKQYDQLYAQEGANLNVSADTIQADLQQNSDLLAKYKSVRIKSDVSSIILRVASHLPVGAMLNALTIKYNEGDAGANNAGVSIELSGTVFTDDPNEQIAVAEEIFSDFKNDKELAQYVSKVDLGSLNRQEMDGRQVVAFNIHCS